MGSACQKQIDNSIYQGQLYFYTLCNIFRDNINSIEKVKIIQLNVYIIATRSIPKFISLIKKYNFLDNENEKLEKDESYEPEKNIEIINQYSQCINLIKDDNGKYNEFIIVNEKFITNMNIIELDNKFVEITIDYNKNLFQIKFSESQIINFNKIQKGFYKFIILDQPNLSSIKPNNNSDKFYINSNVPNPLTNININNINNINKEPNDTLIKLKEEKVIDTNNTFMKQLYQMKNTQISNVNLNLIGILNKVNSQ